MSQKRAQSNYQTSLEKKCDWLVGWLVDHLMSNFIY